MSSAATPMGVVTVPEEQPAVRLRYNNVFLPEYFSTIAISVVISIPFLLVPIDGGIALGRNPHAPVGLAAWVGIIVMLVAVTVRHRGRHRRIVVTRDPELGVLLSAGETVVQLQRLDRCELRIDSFFGRRVRALEVRDIRGNQLIVHDGLDGFPEFLRLVHTLIDHPIEVAPGYEQGEEPIARAWEERHAIFPLTVEASVSRGVIRFFFLIPVAFVEFISNLWMNFELVSRGQAALAVYAAPVTLLLAAFVNRFVSYYLLTSRRMNR